MKRSEIKELIIGSADNDADPQNISRRLEDAGVTFDFSKVFNEKVISKLFTKVISADRELEFTRNLNFVFYRIALTGIAAIVVLLISIFLMEGSISFNSFIGLSDSYDESIVCLLTGI